MKLGSNEAAKFFLGSVSVAALMLGANLAWSAGAVMPSGALGIWYADEYVTSPRKAIPNHLSSQPISANFVGRPRGAFSKYQANNCVVTDSAVSGPDGETYASTLVASGSDWRISGPGYLLPAGQMTVFLDVKSNSGSAESLTLYPFQSGGEQSGAKTATTSWTTISHTWTSTGGITQFFIWNNGTTASLQIDNLRIFAGAVDLGAEVLSGHLYLGNDDGTAIPAFNSNYIDLAGSGKGMLNFLPSVASYTNFTFVATVARSTGGNVGAQPLLGVSLDPYKPSFFIDTPGYKHTNGLNYAAESNGFNPSGLYGYASEPFNVIALRANGTYLDTFINGLHVGRTTLTPPTEQFIRLTLGDFGGFSCGYKVYSMGFWKSALSDAQVADAYLALKTRGLGLSTPINMPVARRVLYAEGDSITQGAFVEKGYVALYGANSSPITNGTNRAVSGSGLTSMNARASAADAFIPAVKETGFKAIYFAMIGTNDDGGGSDSAAYAAALGQHFANRKAAGFTYCVAATLLAKGGNATFNANRAALNTILRSSAWQTTWGIDAVVDFAANATIGTDAAASNTTYFSDGVHPTQAGNVVMETIFRPVINALGAPAVSNATSYGEPFYHRLTGGGGGPPLTVAVRLKAASFAGSRSTSTAGAIVSVRGDLSSVYIGHAAASGSAYSFAGTPVQVTFGGGNSASGGGDTSLLINSDVIPFTWDGVSDIIIAAGNPGSELPSSTGVWADTYYTLASAADAATVSKSGYTLISGSASIVEAVRLNGYSTAATSRTIKVVCDGNSLTAGNGAETVAHNYPAYLRSYLRYGSTVSNVGVGGATTAQRQAANATGPLFQAGAVACLWECSNDLSANQDPAGAVSRFFAWCDIVRAQGYKVVIGTVLPRNDVGNTPYAGFEADRQTVNAALRAGWSSHADALADTAADADIGAPGAWSNTTYFNADQVHLSGAGYERAASIFATAVIAVASALPALGATGVVVEGDSLMAAGTNGPISALFSQMTGMNAINRSNGGDHLLGIDTAYATDTAPYYNATNANTLVIEGGTNDIWTHGRVLADLQALVQSIAAKANTTGFKRVVATIPRRADVVNSTFEGIRTSYNTWLRANYSGFAERLWDLDLIPELSDPNNATYFDADKLHWTGAANLIVADSLRALLGVASVGDTVPNAFSFTDQTGVATNQEFTFSNVVTISGLTAPTPIRLMNYSGGDYSINGGSWTSSPGTINNGDTLQLWNPSSASSGATKSMTVCIGGVVDVWSVTTAAAVAAMPSGATGIWYAKDYDGTKKAIPNVASGTPSTLLDVVTRDNVQALPQAQDDWGGLGTRSTVTGTGPTGATNALTRINAAGDYYCDFSRGSSLTGPLILCYDYKSNTGSSQTFQSGNYNGTMTQMTATTSWQRAALPLGSSNIWPIFVMSADRATGNDLLFANVSIFRGSVDLGRASGASMLFDGAYQTQTTNPATGVLDLSNAGSGFIQFDTPINPSAGFTGGAMLRRTSSGGSTHQAIFSWLNSYNDFTLYLEQGADHIVGSLAGNGPNASGIWNHNGDGWHMITWSYDGAYLDLFYDDARVLRKAMSASALSIRDLLAGSLNNLAAYSTAHQFNSWFYYPRALTLNEIQTGVYPALKSRLNTDGQSHTRGKVVIFEGDSITSTANFYGQQAAASVPFRGPNISVSGSGLANLDTRWPDISNTVPSGSTGTYVLSVFDGANDLEGHGGATNADKAASFLAALYTYTDRARAAGFKVLLCTVLPNSSSNFNAVRAIVNADIRTSVGVHCDAVCDWDLDAQMGIDAAYSTYPANWSDSVHPNETGHARMATIWAAAINSIP